VSSNKILGEARGHIGSVIAQMNVNKKAKDERIDEDSVFYKRFFNCKDVCEQINFNRLFHTQNMNAPVHHASS
jgi:hypothetical protein